MKPVKFHPEARLEFEEAALFYNSRVPGLGNQFFDAIVHATRRIQSDPLRYPPRDRGTRRYLVQRFPYSVVYREEVARIFIVAIAHGSRQPGYWRRRL